MNLSNNLKASLDRYITTPPDDRYNDWYEMVVNSFSDEFYEQYEDWIDNSDLFISWNNKLLNRAEYYDVDENENWKKIGDMTPEKAAKIIERAAKFFKIKP